MTDQERTIKKLSQLLKTANDENYDFIYIRAATAKTIIRLLQGEGKAEKPKPDLVRVFRCPECLRIVPQDARFCRDCGQEIKWASARKEDKT